MDTMFPFGFPLPTAFYLVLYVATLVVHVGFMNYVLAGSAYLAWFTLVSGRKNDVVRDDPVAAPLRDWMPFMLSAAITAGIAPLLFVQILYQQAFYSANLLLFHRWMSILPVLIVGFYMLYLVKSGIVIRAAFIWRLLAAVLVFACFGFTAWSWTENHLLSLNADSWPEQYASQHWFYHNPELFPRLAVWFVGAWPTMATIVAWQNWYTNRGDTVAATEANRRCTLLALGGLFAAAICSGWYVLSLAPELRGLLIGPTGRWYLLVGVVGLGLQSWGWLKGLYDVGFTTRRLQMISLGALLTVAGTSVLREVRRIAAIDIAHLYDLHTDAASVGGLAVFLVFAGLNALLITWCILTVRRGLRNS